MRCKGTLKALYRDYSLGTWVVQLDIEKPVELPIGEKVSVDVVKYREKRSLDANAYYWKLSNEIARVLRISSAEAHNRLLRAYGTPMEIDEQYMYALLPDMEECDLKALRADTYHIAPTDETVYMDGQTYRKYMVIKGSHLYNTAEMSRLIDGTVEEAKELGIETMTPDEIERLKAAWKA